MGSEMCIRDRLRLPTVRAEPAAHKAVSAIRSSTISQAKIINDLLDLSRVSTGKMELDRRDLDFRALVANIVEVTGGTPNAPRVVVRLPEQALPVHADEVRLEQVVWNLFQQRDQVHAAGRHRDRHARP